MVGLVCVECSLSCDCLCSYDFCKHSQDPRFNRDMRLFNRLPVYLGEDLILKIQWEAIHKEIKSIDSITRVMGTRRSIGKVKHRECFLYSVGRYRSAKYTCEGDKSFCQMSNDISYTYKLWNKKIYSSAWVNREYFQKKERQENIQRWWRNYKHNKFMNKYIKGKGYSRFQVLVKQTITDNYFCKNNKKPNLKSKFDLDKISERNYYHRTEVNKVEINCFKRYLDLYKLINTNKKLKELEQTYYIHQIAKLIKPNFHHTELAESKVFHFLGTQRSHDTAFHKIKGPKKEHIDFYQNLFKTCKYSDLSWVVYSPDFVSKWKKYINYD